jgi:BMFP domain-containing protein YqiC
MFKQQILDKISGQISEAIKVSPFVDLENNLKAILKASFEKLDLVSREEFEIQQKVLLQTRNKLEELEQIVKNLEQLNQ